MSNSIPISTSIPKPGEPSAFAPIESSQLSKIVEGQGAQPMALRVVEQPRQFFGRRLGAVGLQRRCVSESRVAPVQGIAPTPLRTLAWTFRLGQRHDFGAPFIHPAAHAPAAV